MRKLTTEEFIAKARLVHGDKYDYSKFIYNDAHTKSIIICPVHGEFLQKPSNHTHCKQGCMKCWEILKKESNLERAKPKFGESVLDKFPQLCEEWDISNIHKPSECKCGSNKKILWHCKKCNYKFYATIVDRTRKDSRGCSKCRYTTVARKLSTPKSGESMLDLYPELCKEWSKDNKILPQNCKPHSHRKIWWECSRCNNKWESAIVNRTWKDAGCSICSFKEMGEKHSQVKDNIESLAKIHPKLCLEWSIKNDRNPETYYQTSGKTVIWKCKDCSFEWKAKIYSRTKNGSGCPKCKKSHGEKRVQSVLDSLKIDYKTQYRILECKNQRPLPFDFALKINNKLVLIEFHGRQHYELGTFHFACTKHFAYRQNNDGIKEKYCKDNNIPLLIIPYTEYNNIEIILENFIKSLV
jgi:hypothetical protein